MKHLRVRQNFEARNDNEQIRHAQYSKNRKIQDQISVHRYYYYFFLFEVLCVRSLRLKDRKSIKCTRFLRLYNIIGQRLSTLG